MLFRYTVAVDCEKHAKYIDTRCRQNACGFEIPITALIKITFFLDMRQSGLVHMYQHFKEMYCLQTQGATKFLEDIFWTTLNMERVRYVPICQSTRHHVPEGVNLEKVGILIVEEVLYTLIFVL
jgi:hypothetical protein